SLIFIGAGSICADQYLRSTNQGSFGLLGIALAHGLTIGIMVSALGHISGGHFNPAITLGFWATKKMGTIESLSYCVAQLLGGVAGAYVLAHILPESAWRPVSLGTPGLADGFTRTQGMI